ncbi:MAG: glycoside hydrolase family 25 protein [Lachnoclostridium sp.]|nr:glycoside hydrolase family 25 protein [Lachnospira sp.]MCM1249153.1 glycoside hydrolase family 25 protein [Lachnoclostridium sp.]
MQLPDDYDDRAGITPTVISAVMAVTLFVGTILVIVLLMNNQEGNRTHKVQSSGSSHGVILDETDSADNSPIVGEDKPSGGKLKPQDLDFWEYYQTQSAEPAKESETAKPSKTPEPVENDPATDGKHTLITYANGKEEWVLISPYLPKHEYDFTKLVCQSDLMKYYVDGKLTSFVGADISKYQDYVDFVKLKKAGVNFVMLRVGARGYGSGQLVLDEYFEDNIKRASDAGLQVGLYFFSQAVTAEEAVEEANMVLEHIGDYRVDYPIAFDMEHIENDTARIDGLSKTEKTTIAKAFLDTIQSSGHKAMIYGNKEWLIKEIDMSKLTAYDVWLSQLQDVPDYPYKFTMWQYKQDASIDGIAGYASLNISFIDYTEK